MMNPVPPPGGEDALISTLHLMCRAEIPLGTNLFVEVEVSKSATIGKSRLRMTTTPSSYPVWKLAAPIRIFGSQNNTPALTGPEEEGKKKKKRSPFNFFSFSSKSKKKNPSPQKADSAIATSILPPLINYRYFVVSSSDTSEFEGEIIETDFDVDGALQTSSLSPSDENSKRTEKIQTKVTFSGGVPATKDASHPSVADVFTPSPIKKRTQTPPISTDWNVRKATFEAGPTRVVAPGDWYSGDENRRSTILSREDTYGEKREEYQGVFSNVQEQYTSRNLSTESESKNKSTSKIKTKGKTEMDSSQQNNNNRFSPDVEPNLNSVSNLDSPSPSPPPSTPAKTASRLFLVTFHLPVTLTVNPNTPAGENPWSFEWDGSMISKTEGSVSNLMDTYWIGSIPTVGYYELNTGKKENSRSDDDGSAGADNKGIPENTGIGSSLPPKAKGRANLSYSVSSNDSYSLTPSDQDYITSLLRPHNCIPIFLPRKIYLDSYVGMCKSVLWPAFHNIDLLDLSLSVSRDTIIEDAEARLSVPSDSNVVFRKPRGDTMLGAELEIHGEEKNADGNSDNRNGGENHDDDGKPISSAKEAGQKGSSSTISSGEQQQPSAGADHHDNDPNPRSVWDQSRLKNWWKSYEVMNETFARVLCKQRLRGIGGRKLQSKSERSVETEKSDEKSGDEVSSEEEEEEIVDNIWVHDYHLSLVPKMIEERGIRGFCDDTSNVGDNGNSMNDDDTDNDDDKIEPSNSNARLPVIFFLHIPFPTSQIFRELNFSPQILESFLSATLVGFHAFNHARHFINSAKRILGIPTFRGRAGGLIGLDMQSRYKRKTSNNRGSGISKSQGCYVCLSHVSIESVSLDQVMQKDTFWSDVEHWRVKGGTNLNFVDQADDSDSNTGTTTPKSKNSSRTNSRAASPHTTMLQQTFNRRRSNGPRRKLLIGSVDVAQKLSGVPLKLVTFETLLHDYPVWKHNVTLIQVVTIPGSRPADESLTLREIRTIVRRLRATYGNGVIVYEEVRGAVVDLHSRVAMYMASDVYFSSAIREGLNLSPLEYVYTRGARAGSRSSPAGVVITSEFSAVTTILNGALRINPFDVVKSADTLDKALSMSRREKEARRARDISFVGNNCASEWSRKVLADLREASGQAGWGGRKINRAQRKEGAEVRSSMASSTANSLERNSLPFHLNNANLLQSYNQIGQNDERKRVIILDYGGTLLTKEPWGKYLKKDVSATSGRKPRRGVLESVKVLAQDKRNVVFVVSGTERNNLENAFPESGGFSQLGLAASDGKYVSWGSANHSYEPNSGEGREGAARLWSTHQHSVDWPLVKKITIPILSKYAARTNGSSVAIKTDCLSWSYFGSDPEWGGMQGKYIVPELETALRNAAAATNSPSLGVRVNAVRGYKVEVIPSAMNKRAVVKRVLASVSARDDIGFVMVLGDDNDDEGMFEETHKWVNEGIDNNELYVHTVTVGKKQGASQNATPMAEGSGTNETTGAFSGQAGGGDHQTVMTTKARRFVYNVREVEMMLRRLAFGYDVEPNCSRNTESSMGGTANTLGNVGAAEGAEADSTLVVDSGTFGGSGALAGGQVPVIDTTNVFRTQSSGDMMSSPLQDPVISPSYQSSWESSAGEINDAKAGSFEMGVDFYE